MRGLFLSDESFICMRSFLLVVKGCRYVGEKGRERERERDK